MTRKKSRPTHRENAATVPSNEGGFYKMFWNSMETNPETNGPGYPSQGDVSSTSPPVIIIDDSPEGSPCARDENACENLVVPLPIKEETCEDLGKILTEPSLCENAAQNSQESLSGINGDCASNQTCLPDNLLTSQSINNSPVPALQTDLNSIDDTPETVNEIDFPCRPPETPSTAEDSVNPVENCQVGEQITSEEHVEMFPDNSSYIVSTGLGSEECSNSSYDVVSNLPEHTKISKVEPVTEVHAEGTLVTAEYTSEELSSESPVATDPQVSAEDNEESSVEGPSKTGIPTSTALNFLKSLLEEPNENLENMRTNFAELPALQDSVSEPQNGGDEFECEAVPASPAKENYIHGDENVTGMEVDLGTTVIGSTLPTDDIMMSSTRPTDKSMTEDHTNEIVDDEDEEDLPPDHNFLAKNIKVDSSGISRSLKDFKASIRSLYRAYLKDEFLLKTVSAMEPPLDGAPESAVEVQETPTVPSFEQLTPICNVKLERLPDCIIKKNIITMSDETLKSWKKKSLRDQNEDKFRHLKVWRRGRTLLWRECELAGMDRATYDKQVAYVKKHKLSENSSDDDASGKGSGNDAASRHSDSSEESSSDEECNENSEETYHFQNSSENQSVPSSPLTSLATATDSRSPEDEYTVERTSPNQSSSTKTPSALKITIRKTSTSKSDDDREKPTDEEGIRFPVPAQHLGKSRKVATKRTFRRLSQPGPKPSVPSKTAASDPKKGKSAEEEDLYDQSLLGTRSYEVENFNLLEKWDIPFEEPTLFRSPRAASRLAQIKTKEALITARQRQAAQKTSTSVTTSPSATTTTTSSTATVSKEVRDTVDFLCSKTVEAMLFPESDSGGANKPTKAGLDGKESNTHRLMEVPSKALVPSEETSSNLDESSEVSLSETNSTLDASSDFGGSTASLVSEDFVPPKNKSPPKSRRRRRGAQSWGKKKKVMSKGSGELMAMKGSIEGDENSLKDSSSSPLRPSEFPSTENLIQGKEKADRDVGSSQVHSTQVPVVSEGPGQSPRESEDESARQVKEPLQQEGSNQTVFEFSEEEPGPAAVPRRISVPKKAVQEEAVQPRLTRSRQPTVQLDPELLQNIGARKRKPKADTQVPVSQGEISKKPKQEPPNKSDELAAKVFERPSPTAEQVTNDHLNTQVPEVSEGPGEIVLDRENKRGEENQTVTWEPRRLRSRSRGPPKSSAPIISDISENKPKVGPVQVEQDKQADRIQAEEHLELESPQSPPPEPADSEPLINGRVTRSRKRRSGPAYIAVKSTITNALPSVCDIVDSIAGHNLPTPSKLFDDSTAKENLSTDPVTVYNVQTPTIEDTIIPTTPTSTSSELVIPVVRKEIADDTATIPSKQGSLVNSELEKAACAMKSTMEPASEVGSESAVESPGATGQIHELGELPTVSSEIMQPSAPAIHGNVDTEGSGKSAQDSGDSGATASLAVEQPVPDSVGSGRLVVLDTLNNILAVSSPTKEPSVSTASPPSPPPLRSGDLSSPLVSVPSSLPPVSSVLATPTVTSTSLPTFPSSTQDISSILPGTFLNSLFTNTISSNLTPYGNDGTSLPDDPDGDLVIDEGDAPEGDARIDVNFWENLTNADLSDTNADFSDDDNNTDLADKIDKIIKDQIHQDPVPVPSLKSKENTLLDTNQTSHETPATEGEKNASTLNRRDSIDERTGLPNNFIQRLRDPRIRSRLLSHLEDAETNSKAESALVPFLNSLTSNVPASTSAKAQPAEISKSDPRKNVDAATVQSGFPIPVVDSSPLNLQGQAVSPMVTHPIKVVHSNTVSPGLATALGVTQPLVTAGNSLVVQGPLIQTENSEGPELPPDPSKVDFLVPPSDDEEEEEENIKRRPSKKKKEIDVELMYKSPLEDLQSEARPAYGDRAPRRYADCFPRRKIGEDRQSRRDDRYSRIDGPRDRSRDRRYEERSRSKSRDRRFEERGRSRSRDGRYEDRGRSQSRGRFEERGRDRSRSRDRRSFYDRPSTDYDPYSCEEREVATHHVDMQTPYSHSPWSAGDPSFSYQPVMAHPLPSPHWQPNYHPEPNHPPHPPIFMPEPPKIDYMETRLINLELLPKTTNLDISPLKKVFSYFDKDSLQLLQIPSPKYDPNDKPETVKMLDPVSQQMIDFTQTPRPTSGVTKEYFKHIAPDLTLGDVIQYHFISPAYLKVRDNDDDSSLSSSDEEGEMDESKQKMLHHRKSELEHTERFSKQVLDHIQKRESQSVLGTSKRRDAAPSVEHHSRTAKSIHGDQEKPTGGIGMTSDPLQNILQNLPLLRDQYSMNQPPLVAPPPPEWNDVDLRMARAEGEECLSTSRNPSPPKHSARSRSRSNSPYRSRRSRSPRRRRRARSRSSSPRVHSDMSISPSRSRSRSPPYSHSRSSRRRRSRSRSSERTRSRRSRSPRRSTSISPSRKYSRR